MVPDLQGRPTPVSTVLAPDLECRPSPVAAVMVPDLQGRPTPVSTVMVPDLQGRPTPDLALMSPEHQLGATQHHDVPRRRLKQHLQPRPMAAPPLFSEPRSRKLTAVAEAH
jgi:hypothetical protein